MMPLPQTTKAPVDTGHNEGHCVMSLSSSWGGQRQEGPDGNHMLLILTWAGGRTYLSLCCWDGSLQQAHSMKRAFHSL